MKETGVVTTYFQSRHYGFVTSDVDGVSRFFHNTNYQGTPKLGTRVEFELADPTRIGKEKQAVNIVPLPQAEKESGDRVLADVLPERVSYARKAGVKAGA